MSKPALPTIARDLHATTAQLVTTIDGAIRNLNDSLGGYPTEPGTLHTTECPHPDCDHDRPCPTHENKLGINHDQAAHTLTTLDKQLRHIHNQLRALTATSTKWATARIDNTTVQTTLATLDIWCKNCAEHGFTNPCKEGSQHCEWCLDFKARESYWPDREIIDTHSRRPRLRPDDLARFKARELTRREEARLERKKRLKGNTT